MSTQNALMICFTRLLMRFLPALALGALLAVASSCSNSSSNMTTPPPPSFTLSASSTSLSLQRGKQDSDTITVVPLNNFDGTVAFTVSGLPTGVTAAFNPGDATTSSTLTLTAASTASLASSTLTITGTSSSVTATATIDLTVVSGGFTLSASSPSLTVLQGASGTDTITVVPTGGFNGSVALSASGLPTGVTASFNPPSTTSTSSLTLTASATATTGTSTITITGTSNGLTSSVNLSLTVGGFSLSLSPSSLTVQQGSTGSATVTVTEVAFSGAVALSASGLPTGTTASFNPTSTSTQSTLTFTVSSTTTTGTSTVTISGKVSNVTQTTTLALTVSSSTSGGGLPSSFFALSNVDPTDNPSADGMSYGAVGHPDRLAWPYIEPTKGTFDFTLYDQYVATAPKEGTGGSVAVMVLTLGMTPGWAVANQSTCRTLKGGVVACQAPPDSIQDWQDFITALVQHYNGSPSTPHIKYYEIWNEWNLQDAQNGYWMGTPPQLAALQSTACAIIHATSGIQYSLVLTPSTFGPAHNVNDKGAVDLQTYFNSGGTNCPGSTNSNLIEGVSFHGIVADSSFTPYPFPGENCTQPGCNGAITDMTATYRQVADLNGLQGTPLLDTEGSFETANITDADQRAAWLAQFYALQAGLSSSDQLQWVSWFTWGLPGVAGNIENANKTPNTAGIAYNQLYNWLPGRVATQCSQSGTVWTCPLTGSSGYQAQIMWDDSQTCNNGTCSTTQQPAPSSATQWRDLAGTTHTITNGQVPVGLKPILVEN